MLGLVKAVAPAAAAAWGDQKKPGGDSQGAEGKTSHTLCFACEKDPCTFLLQARMHEFIYLASTYHYFGCF